MRLFVGIEVKLEAYDNHTATSAESTTPVLSALLLCSHRLRFFPFGHNFERQIKNQQQLVITVFFHTCVLLPLPPVCV